MLYELVFSGTFSVMKVDEGARAMLLDQISASILQLIASSKIGSRVFTLVFI